MAYTALDILQSLGQSRSTCNLVIANGDHRIEVWVLDGIVCHIEGCSNHDLHTYLVEKNPFIFLKPVKVRPQMSMNIPVHKLVMDIAHQYDHISFDKNSLTPKEDINPSFPLTRPALQETTIAIHPHVTSTSNFQTILSDDSEMSDKPHLLIFASNRKTNLLIGRSKKCDIYCNDPLVSRIHCCISFNHIEKSFYVQDLDSSNGTYLNDVRSRNSPANKDDIIRIGSANFILQLETPPEEDSKQEIDTKNNFYKNEKISETDAAIA